MRNGLLLNLVKSFSPDQPHPGQFWWAQQSALVLGEAWTFSKWPQVVAYGVGSLETYEVVRLNYFCVLLQRDNKSKGEVVSLDVLCIFVIQFSKWSNENCEGIQIRQKPNDYSY